MTAHLRAGVVGLGFGASVHVPALRAASPPLQVVAICGTDSARARRAAAVNGIPVACTAVAGLLELELDVVTLAVPPGEMPRLAAPLLDAGVALLFEKPIATDVLTAAALVERAAGTPAAVDFEFADLAPFRALAAEVSSEMVGTPLAVEVTWVTRSRALEQQRWGWKTDAATGGGVVNLLGSHVLHFIEMCFGAVTTVRAATDHRLTSAFAPAEASSAPDGAEIILRTARGVHVSIVLSNAAVGVQEHRWRVRCTDGALTLENRTLDPASGFVLRVHREDSVDNRRFDRRSSEDLRVAAVARVLSRLQTAVRGGRRATPDLESGVRVQALLDAVNVSATTGREILPSARAPAPATTDFVVGG